MQRNHNMIGGDADHRLATLIVGVLADYLIKNVISFYMEFFTATINSWKYLLKDDSFKDIIIESLQWLSNEQKVLIHGFVVMPNHIHILWTILNKTGRHPKQSLLSYTAHCFKQKIKHDDPFYLQQFNSSQNDRQYHFWERHSKTIDVRTKESAFQILNYMHTNPMQEKWQLVSKEEDYLYSSAKYYCREVTTFPFLKSIYDYI